MASKIDIISNAMLLIGTPTINSLTDGTTRSNVAAALYESTTNSLLCSNRWRFAHARQELSQLSEQPAHTWRYAYQVPADMLMPVSIDPLGDYEIYGDQLHTNLSDVTLDYINRPSESKFPGYFVKLLEIRLAVEFAIPITENRALKETLKEDMKMALNQAMWADAQGRPPEEVANHPLIDVRF